MTGLRVIRPKLLRILLGERQARTACTGGQLARLTSGIRAAQRRLQRAFDQPLRLIGFRLVRSGL